MSTLVLVTETKPEPKLDKVSTYRLYLSKEDKEKIMKELEKNDVEIEENDHVIMYVDIEIKRYRK